jgi:hypothetical protein
MPRFRSRTTGLVAAGVASGLVLLLGGGLVANEVLGRDDVQEVAVDGSVQRVVVRADGGNVEVVPSADGRTHIRAERHYLFGRPTIEPKLVGGTLTVDPSCGGPALLNICSVDLRIEIGPGVAVDARSDAGDVQVRGIDGRGGVKAASDAGDVTVELTTAPARLDASSDAGDVTVRVPRSTYAVDAGTDAGDTHVEGLVQDDLASSTIRAQSDAGDVTVEASPA